jgi:hypothetical protein
LQLPCIFAVCCSICNLTTRVAMLTGAHLPRVWLY